MDYVADRAQPPSVIAIRDSPLDRCPGYVLWSRRMADLTTGNETKRIVTFAVPMLIGNVFQQFYTMVDSIILGQGVGKEALGATGASFPILFLMVAVTWGVTTGATIMISQFYGAKDFDNLSRTKETAFIFLLVASFSATVIGIAFSESILRLMRTPEAILPHALAYLRIMFAGMVFLFGYATVSAILRGLGDAKRPLYFLIIASILNILLDLLFVLVFRWGIAGAAWATVIAQGVSLAIGLGYMQRQEHLRTEFTKIRFDFGLFKKMLKIGVPSGVRNSLVSLGIVAVTRIVNPFGTNVVAGFTAASRIDSFAMLPGMTLSMAVSTFVGQNLGAGRADRVQRGFRAAMVVGVGISLVISAILIVFRTGLIGLFNPDAGVIRNGAAYLTVVSSFYVVFAALSVTAGVLLGAGDTMAEMIFTLVALWAVRIPAAALLSRAFGTVGIWWSIPAAWVIGFVGRYTYYLTGRWKHKVVVSQSDAPTPVGP